MVRAFVAGLLLTGFFAAGWQAPSPQAPSNMSIERLDHALDRLIDPAAKIELIGEGYIWSEGPVWVKSGGYLLFSDIPNNVIHRYKQGEGVREYLKPSGYTGKEARGGEVGSNGLTLDAQ